MTPPGRPSHSFLQTAFEGIAAYLPPALTGETSTQYKYNLDKQLTAEIRPDGEVISYNYGGVTGELDSISTPDGDYTFTYDSSLKRLASATSPDSVSSSFSYYGPFKSEETQTLGTTKTVKWSFDDEHRVVKRNVDGAVSTVSYDRDGLLVRSGRMRYARGPYGEIRAAYLDNGSVHYSYDEAYGEVSGVEYRHKGKTIFSQNYGRDKLGRIISEGTRLRADRLFYDNAGRYTGRAPLGEKTLNFEYRYDENGNRVYSRTPEGVVSATYDAQDRIQSWGDFEFLHNQNGDLLQKTDTSTAAVTTYDYDVFGNLKEVTLPSSDVIAYKIDGMNRRVERRLNGTVTARYLYEDQLRIAAEFDGSGVLVKHFVYGEGVNAPDCMEYNGDRYILVKDVRGSVRMVVDSSSGAVLQEIEYDDWGKVVKDTNPGFQPFGFAGGLYDPDTKLVRFGAREYDPETGRWTSKDPILFNGGDTNLYGYVLNDPVNLIDPNGKNPLLIALPYLAFEGGFFLGAAINRLFFDIPFSQTYKDANPLMNLTDSIVPTSGFFLDPTTPQSLQDMLKHKQRTTCEPK